MISLIGEAGDEAGDEANLNKALYSATVGT